MAQPMSLATIMPSHAALWASIQRKRDAQMKQQPANDGPEYTRWSLKWEELTRTIGDWGDAWTHRKVTTLAQFVGWLAEALSREFRSE